MFMKANKEAMHSKKIFAKHNLMKYWYPGYHIQFLLFNNKKTNKSIFFKLPRNVNRHSTKDDMQVANKHMRMGLPLSLVVKEM